MRQLLLLVVVCAASSASATEAIDTLYDAVAADLAAGKPLTVEVQVALCDNTIITCGGRGLGDGDDLARNLYWATDGGLRGWFERRGSPWRRVSRTAGGGGDAGVLETVVYEQRFTPSGAWVRRGVTAPFIVRVTAHGWRGRAIDGALDRFVHELYDGDAHIAAYVGHNGWMDRDTLTWPKSGGAHVRGFIAIACLTRDYLQRALSAPTRVPLLLTRDLLFAGSHALDGAITAFARGGSAADLRLGASRAYADGEKKPLARVQTLFTN